MFAAACTVSLSSFLGIALREVISVRLGILSQTLELRIGVGGGLRAVTPPVALHCLWDKSQGIRVGVRDRGGGDGVQMKKRPADSLPPLTPPQSISPHPSFVCPERVGGKGGGEVIGWGRE